ncbi:MAG: branched-chain amino acid ABC transporter permease [Sporolactobacillus sp.]|jgi:ABC-type branched-subunit amino acid transport system permease subunit|nr:branched-chain amino acid ABC transporter permease [Sporolactobacillus sp.]MCI1880623.1 branched-chain amino acid ABC transporter permease [Sporolactobacillus sp.]
MNKLIVLISELLLFALFIYFLLTPSTGLVILYIAACFALVIVALITTKPFRIIAVPFKHEKKLTFFLSMVLLIIVPFFIWRQPYWLLTIALAGIYIILANGINLQTGTTGLTNFSGAAFFGTGAYTVGLLSVHFNTPAWLTVPAAIFAAMLVGFILFIPVIKVKGNYLALVTIAFGLMFNIMLNNTSAVGGPNGISNIKSIIIGPVDFTSMWQVGSFMFNQYANYYWLIIIITVLCLLFVRFICNSPVGLILNYIRDDEWSSKSQGVNITFWKFVAFSCGNALLGLGGALYAYLIGYIAPDVFGFQTSLLLLSMVILGGMDSIAGVTLAAFMMEIITEKLRVIQDYRFLIFGLLVIIMIIFRREGLIPAGVRSYFPKFKKSMARKQSKQSAS